MSVQQWLFKHDQAELFCLRETMAARAGLLEHARSICRHAITALRFLLIAETIQVTICKVLHCVWAAGDMHIKLQGEQGVSRPGALPSGSRL